MEKELDDILLLLKIGLLNVPMARNKILSLMGENKMRLTGASEGNKGTDNSK